MLGKIYFATGWFNPLSDEEEKRVKTKLRMLGYNVFSPRESFILSPNASEEEREMVYKENLKNIDECDIFFGITDYKDMGTLVECGIVQGINLKDKRKRKIVYYCETLKPDMPFNVMLSKPADVVITDFNDLDNLPTYLKKGKSYVGTVQ